MSVTRDMVMTWRHPRQGARRQLAGAVGEERAFGYLVIACVLIFIAQWPRLLVTENLSADISMEIRVGAALLGWIFFAPLLFYGLAALFHLIGKLFGGKGNWLRARIAVFWGLLAVSPLWLLNGVCVAVLPSGLLTDAIGLVVLILTCMILSAGMIEAERPIDAV